MNKKSQLQFTHRCSVLLESGISLSETFEILIKLEKVKRNKQVLEKMKGDVQKGISLTKSMLNTGISFDPTLISMISFGESAGILSQSMRQAREILEKGSLIKRKLLGALIYPAFIAGATIVMTLFLVMYIFPKIIPLFMSMDITLPFLTRAVQSLYLLLLHYGIWIGLGFISVSFIFVVAYKKNIKIKLKTQTMLLTLPILGTFLQKYFLSTFCRSIGTLLESGQNLPKILEQVSESSTTEVYKRVWHFVQLETIKGGNISSALNSFATLVPSMVPDMLSIGERTGSLSSMFHHISRIYEEELDEIIKQLSTVIEPVLMIGMGLIVGSVALSIILPIYEVTNHLTH
jgi:type IV pilus assembly protein PilC